jgi:hypothetical protein
MSEANDKLLAQYQAVLRQLDNVQKHRRDQLHSQADEKQSLEKQAAAKMAAIQHHCLGLRLFSS